MTTKQLPYKPHWVAKEIRRMREERGLSQLTLASMADTTPATLANYESGKRNMHLVSVDAVLEALDYEIDIHPKDRQKLADVRQEISNAIKHLKKCNGSSNVSYPDPTMKPRVSLFASEETKNIYTNIESAINCLELAQDKFIKANSN